MIEVQTGLDSIIWQKDARYEYYKHGPLARVVLGEQLIQGLDYSYTLQGWLKGINSTAINSDYDIGQDGKPGTSNQYVARDVYGLNLNYFGGDYSSINKGYDPFPDHWAFLPDSSKRPLYNGNISGIAMSLLPLSSSSYFGGATMLYRYRYDQLNRLTRMDALNGFDHTNNNWTGLTAVQQYKERVRYDANGNIQGYLRNGHNGGSDIEKDSLSYKYYSGTNRLKYLKDITPSSNYSGTSILDLENQTNTSNYQYDSIGNLISDAYEGITNIRWNVYGKIREITRTPSASLIASKISYIYDAQGNRIGEIIDRSVSPAREYTWYVRDAQGNVLAIYNAFGSTDLSSLIPNQRVRPIYGSSRIGTHQESVNVDGGPQAMDQLDNFFFTRGKRVYQLSNHLDNVVTTLTDRKFGVPVGAAGTPIDYYDADIFTANDYFPFGMRMLGRTYIPLGVPYRYGFNGKENDDDVKGIANQQDYGMRIYDPRVGRFLSVDPISQSYPELTPYQFASNTPIQAIDIDGLEGGYSMDSHNEQLKRSGKLVIKKIENRTIYNQSRVPNTAFSRNQLSQASRPRNEFEQHRWKIVQEREYEKVGYNSEGKPKPLTQLAKNKTWNAFADNLALPMLEGYSYLSGLGEAGAVIKAAVLAKTFSKGGSKLVSSAMLKEYPGSTTFGSPAGTFVAPSELIDDLLSQGLNRTQIATKLGITNPAFLEGSLIRIDITPKGLKELNLRFPTGKEAGANNLFVPGGATIGNVPEAVVNGIPKRAAEVTTKTIKLQ